MMMMDRNALKRLTAFSITTRLRYHTSFCVFCTFKKTTNHNNK